MRSRIFLSITFTWLAYGRPFSRAETTEVDDRIGLGNKMGLNLQSSEWRQE